MKRSIYIFVLLFLSSELLAQELRFFEFGFRNPLPDSMNIVAATHDTAVVAKALAQLALPESQRNLFINGQIQYGTETNNPLYTWHFVTDSWELTEIAVEVCDGRPDDVENDKQYWIDLIGYYCPWTSYLKREIIPSEVGDAGTAKIRLYPNPTSGLVMIDADPSIQVKEIYVLDAAGKVELSTSTRKAADLTSFPQGHYYIVVRYFGGNVVYKIMRH